MSEVYIITDKYDDENSGDPFGAPVQVNDTAGKK